LPDTRISVGVEIVNRSKQGWRVDKIRPLNLSYHWMKGSEILRWDGLRTPLPIDNVKAGQSVTVDMLVEAPHETGKHTLVLTLVQEGECWFEDKGFLPARVEVEILAYTHIPGGYSKSPLEQKNQRIQNYIDVGLNQVEGWGIDQFLAKLFVALVREQERQKIDGNLFEIGVHHGRCSILLGLLARNAETLAVMDLFERQDLNIDQSGCGSREIFLQNMQLWAPDVTFEVLTTNSLEFDFASSKAVREGLRFAHIDGAHHVEAVLNDIEKTERHLVEGGIMVLDDFLHSGFPGVNEAANRYLGDGRRRLAPFGLGHNKLLLTTPGFVHRYAETLRVALPSHLSKTVKFYSHNAVCLDY
jgi:Methyltransferase domain